MRYVVMFSSGAGSWAAARLIVDAHGADNVTLLFTDTAMEDEDNYRFLNDAAADLGAELVQLRDGRDVWDVFKDSRMIGNTRLSVCSRILKQEPARAWLNANRDPETTTVVVGIDWSESHRMAAVIRSYAPYAVLGPLCDPPYRDRGAIFADLAARGIKRPRLYDMGFAHANCGGFCVRAGQGQFAQLLREMPDRYAWHEKKEQDMRDYLGKDVSILRDRRGGATVPLTLRGLREQIETDESQIDLFDLGGCGCFVEAS
jgi:hypothetical protein